ncbi:MAG TPA: winged helix-turn-helix transcriptional regulator [Anaerolineae bacterium]|nr:winged helix-turn-helix transcriptional regulator [Anaerolineae bacterium]
MKEKSVFAIFGRKSEASTWYLLFETGEFDLAKRTFAELSAVQAYDDLRPFRLIDLMDDLQQSSNKAETVQIRTLPTSEGGVIYDENSGFTYVGDNKVFLTYLETILLKLFQSREGKLVKKELIFKEVWGEHYRAGTKDDAKIEKLVSRLREKLEKHSSQQHISTHRGLGYLFNKEGFE